MCRGFSLACVISLMARRRLCLINPFWSLTRALPIGPYLDRAAKNRSRFKNRHIESSRRPRARSARWRVWSCQRATANSPRFMAASAQAMPPPENTAYARLSDTAYRKVASFGRIGYRDNDRRSGHVDRLVARLGDRSRRTHDISNVDNQSSGTAVSRSGSIKLRKPRYTGKLT
jgi:hypothetical protein